MQPVVLIRDLYAAKRAAGRPVISFEFFPPKTEDGERNFFDKTLPQLAAPGIHFYTLNKVCSTTRILHNLGLV